MEHQAQLGLPEPGLPHEARAYLAAVRRHYAPGVKRPPTNADIAGAHIPRLSARGWDHRKHLLRSKKLGGRDWVEVWPPPLNWHPSWEALIDAVPPAAEPDGSDGLVHMVVDEVYDPNNGNRLIERRIIRTLGHFGAAASMFLPLLLDLSDGRFDGTFNLARFGKDAFHGVFQFLCNGQL